MLDQSPKIIGHIGFAGNIGWYDYSFRDDRLNVPLQFYQAKIGPGRAMRMQEYQYLLTSELSLEPEHHEIITAWRDGEFVRLTMSDREFTEHLARRLELDLNQLGSACEKIVTVLHHLPRRDLVWYRGEANWDFVAAFLGSQRFGDIVDRVPNLKLCLAGHNHRSGVVNGPDWQYISIGSTYVEKILLEFDL